MCAITMEQDRELTIVQVAYRLSVSEMTVRRRIEAGRIQARKEGNEWRIKESELQRYIRSTQTDEMKAVRPEEVE
jgi:excisionase family DNA binding protein